MIWFTIITKLIDFLIIIVIVLISLAYLTLIERKVMGIMQRRKGPNVVGVVGLLQPLSASGIPNKL
jgi:NADH:ubiquinone oxidoreductase subunit H